MRIPYHVVRERHGKRLAYWCPTPRMKAAGFRMVPLGPDGPDAWREAQAWNDRWQAHRQGVKAAEKPAWPRGSLGEAYDRYRATEGWNRKQARTREDWQRGWRYIAPIFGDIAPHTIDYDLIDGWYADLIETAGVREAHRAMKIWRALFVVAAAMSNGRPYYCTRGADPSLGVRRVTPKGRGAVWQEPELRRIIHRAWREGYRGLACLVSIMWDTAFSPVDARTLAAGQIVQSGRFGAFAVSRAKTGQAAIGTLSRRSSVLMRAYLHGLGVKPLPTTPLFRTREGAPYRKNSLAEDFRDVRRMIDPKETRQMLDIRRSVSIEARAGGASHEMLAAKLANTVNANVELERTYQPVDLEAVLAVDRARITARQRARRNGSGAKS